MNIQGFMERYYDYANFHAKRSCQYPHNTKQSAILEENMISTVVLESDFYWEFDIAQLSP